MYAVPCLTQGFAFDSTGDTNLLNDLYRPPAALMTLTVDDLDSVTHKQYSTAVTVILDQAPQYRRAISDAVLRKEHIVHTLVNYMLQERTIGWDQDWRRCNYKAAGQAVTALIRRLKEELETLPPEEATIWRRYAISTSSIQVLLVTCKP